MSPTPRNSVPRGENRGDSEPHTPCFDRVAADLTDSSPDCKLYQVFFCFFMPTQSGPPVTCQCRMRGSATSKKRTNIQSGILTDSRPSLKSLSNGGCALGYAVFYDDDHSTSNLHLVRHGEGPGRVHVKWSMSWRSVKYRVRVRVRLWPSGR